MKAECPRVPHRPGCDAGAGVLDGQRRVEGNVAAIVRTGEGQQVDTHRSRRVSAGHQLLGGKCGPQGTDEEKQKKSRPATTGTSPVDHELAWHGDTEWWTLRSRRKSPSWTVTSNGGHFSPTLLEHRQTTGVPLGSDETRINRIDPMRFPTTAMSLASLLFFLSPEPGLAQDAMRDGRQLELTARKR